MPFAPKSRMRRPVTENNSFSAAKKCTISESLDSERLRSVLHPVPLRTVFVREEDVGEEDLIPAAVLFPIVLRESGPAVLLTQRTAHLREHPGQISFPGGRVEPEDASPAHTALRETEEEIGLTSAHIEIVGYLPEYRTITGFRVMPVVGLVRPPFDLHPDPSEVADVFEVPLAFLMDSANHQQHAVHNRGKLRYYYAMPYEDYFIWGATAGIIVTLARALAA